MMSDLKPQMQLQRSGKEATKQPLADYTEGKKNPSKIGGL